ncbi:MAG: hypothetical protein ACREF6_22425 [Alphaproteobacteria bacterium]
MRRKKVATTGSTYRRTIPERPFDEADWVDWDHWQTVEELQNFMNGLTDISSGAEAALAESSDEFGQRDHIARQIHRHGLEVDG